MTELQVLAAICLDNEYRRMKYISMPQAERHEKWLKKQQRKREYRIEKTLEHPQSVAAGSRVEGIETVRGLRSVLPLLPDRGGSHAGAEKIQPRSERCEKPQRTRASR